jgi:hypothetical protein
MHSELSVSTFEAAAVHRRFHFQRGSGIVVSCTAARFQLAVQDIEGYMILEALPQRKAITWEEIPA